jgi:hypothetical protein
MVEGGFLNAAPFAAVEGVKFAVKPDGDIRDVVIGALSGAAGGAATSALSEAGVLARMAGVGAAAAGIVSTQNPSCFASDTLSSPTTAAAAVSGAMRAIRSPSIKTSEA